MSEAESTPEPRCGRKDYVKKNSNYVGNRTSDIPAWSAVLQPTAPRFSWFKYNYFLLIHHYYLQTGIHQTDGWPQGQTNLLFSGYQEIFYTDKTTGGRHWPLRFSAEIKDSFMMWYLSTKCDVLDIVAGIYVLLHYTLIILSFPIDYCKIYVKNVFQHRRFLTKCEMYFIHIVWLLWCTVLFWSSVWRLAAWDLPMIASKHFNGDKSKVHCEAVDLLCKAQLSWHIYCADFCV
jgi:hypothetical protein